MSIINIGKAIAPIAKKIGDEVTEGVSKKVDDWGWQGGKPGEVTGGDFKKAYDNHYSYVTMSPTTNKDFYSMENKANKQFQKAYEKGKPAGKVWYDIINTRGMDKEDPTKNALIRFNKLEKADFPREWTGKAFPLTSRYDNFDLQKSSDIMRNLNNTQRQNFIDVALNDKYYLFPKEVGKVIESPYTDDIINMLPEWEGSLDDLIKAVSML